MRTKIALGIVAVVLLVWIIIPDPLPILIDDIIAAITLAAVLLKLIAPYIKKGNK